MTQTTRDRVLLVLLSLLLLGLAVCLPASLVYAQGAGLWIVAPGTGRPVCTTITSPVTNQSWCFDAANGSVDYWNGSAWIAISGGGGGGAPVDATYLLVSPNATLTNSRQYLPGTNMNTVDSGAGGTYTMNLNNAVSLLGPPVITIAPTGNPGSTLTTLSVQSSTSSTSRVFQGAFGLTSSGGVADKVGLYAGVVGNSGTFDLWSFNTVLTQSAASGSYNAQGAELDINNLNANRGTADAGAGLAAPVTYGLSITGASTFSKTAAILISENAHMWNRGIVVANDSIATTGSSFQDLGNPGKVIDIRGHPTYGFFQDQPDVLNQAQGGMILGPFATPGGLPAAGHAGRAAYSISDTSLYCDNGAAWLVCNVVAGGSVGGSGTVNFLPVWTGSSTIGNSLVLQSANRLTLSPTSATTQTISAGFAAAGAGAELNLLGGIAAGGSGAGGGNVFVGAGAADGAGTGGTVSLQGGNGGTAGGIIIQSGNATAGNGEAISITGGTGTGHGADIFVTGGAATAGVQRGGGVFLQGGNGFGGGAEGVIDLQSGAFVMTPTALLVGFGQGTATGNTSINLNLKGNSTVSGNQSLLINLEGNGTLSDTKTFTVLSNNADLILLGDGVTPTFDAYVQQAGGTIWGEVNVSPSSTGMIASLFAADAATTNSVELDVLSPNAVGGAGTGSVRLIPWGSRSSHDGKVTELRFYDADVSKYVGFKAPDPITTTTIWALPVSDGSSGTCLSTNGGGVLGWANCSSGGTGLTSLNGQTGATQTFAKVDDTNVTLTIASSANVHTFTMGWAGTLAAGRLNANVVQGVTNDTNVTGSISAQNLTLGWTGTLAAGRLNANVVQSVTNDTNVTGVISAQNLTLGWTGTLGVARGGTGLASGTSGGIPAYTGATTITSSALLTNHAMVVGGGAGAVPKTLAALTDGQLYIGRSGLDPLPAGITAGTGISVTPGAGTITIAATGGTGTVTTTGSPANGNLTKFSGATSITNGDLSGDVTTAGTLATTIAANAVTFAKMQTIPTLTLMSNLTGGAAVPGANTLSQILDTVLGATQGSIIYRDSGAWAMLVPSTSGFVLQTQGPAANPIWAAVSGTGSVTHVTGPLTANAIVIGNGGGDIRTTNPSGGAIIALNNGQTLIGRTGGAPAAATIGTSSLTPTPGSGSFSLDLPSLTTNGVVLGAASGPYTSTALGPASSVLQGNGGAPVFTQTPQVGGVTTTGNPGLTLLPFGAGSGNTGEIRFRELSANGVDYAAFKGADSVAIPYVLVLPNGIGSNGQALSIINQTAGPPAVATMGWLTVPSTTPFTGTSCGAGTAAQVMSAAGQFTTCIPVVSAAGGATTQILFNLAGVESGDAGLTWNNSTKVQTIGGAAAFGKSTVLGDVTRNDGAMGGLTFPTFAGSFIDVSDYATNNIAGLVINVRQNSASPGTHVKSGIQIFGYQPPDNGGEGSGIWSVQTGGGNAASFFKLSSSSAPAGQTAFPANGWAVEIQTADSTAGLFLVSGAFGSTLASNAMHAVISNSVSKGINVGPSDGLTFDTRPAYEVANLVANGPNSTPQFQVLLNGSVGVGQAAPTAPGRLSVLGSVSMGALKAPSTIQFSSMTPGSVNNASFLLGSDAAAPVIEFFDNTPTTYPTVGSAGFIMYPRATTGSVQNAPTSIFMQGRSNNGSGETFSAVELENKVNWDGDGLAQLWLEIPSGTPIIRFKGITNGAGIRTHDQGSSLVTLQAFNGASYIDMLRVQNPGTVTFPQLAGSGNAMACLDANGKIFRGTSTTCP